MLENTLSSHMQEKRIWDILIVSMGLQPRPVLSHGDPPPPPRSHNQDLPSLMVPSFR